MKEMWDNRYADNAYAYGIAPNNFLRETLIEHQLRGNILFPAEGEGRNAVYAAKQGLEVSAFDISIEGKNKALKLAKEENVNLNYQVGDFFNLDIINHQYDAVALIYAHFPPAILSKYHQKLAELVKSNGLVILEGFSTNHLKYQADNPAVGGPNKIEFLFSKESIQKDFPNFEIIKLEEAEISLDEGKFHKGIASVIRFIGRKVK